MAHFIREVVKNIYDTINKNSNFFNVPSIIWFITVKLELCVFERYFEYKKVLLMCR